MKPDDCPPPNEQDAFFHWVWSQANAESDGMPETQLITNEGESIEPVLNY